MAGWGGGMDEFGEGELGAGFGGQLDGRRGVGECQCCGAGEIHCEGESETFEALLKLEGLNACERAGVEVVQTRVE